MYKLILCAHTLIHTDTDKSIATLLLSTYTQNKCNGVLLQYVYSHGTDTIKTVFYEINLDLVIICELTNIQSKSVQQHINL